MGGAVGFANHSHFAVEPRKADAGIITPFYREENRGSHLLMVARLINGEAKTQLLVFFSPPHGLWENTTLLMNWLNGFPEEKLWEGSRQGDGLGMAGQGQAEGRGCLESRQGAKAYGATL